MKMANINNCKLANIIFNKNVDFKTFYDAFIKNQLTYADYENCYKDLGEKLTKQEFYTLMKTGKKLQVLQ